MKRTTRWPATSAMDKARRLGLPIPTEMREQANRERRERWRLGRAAWVRRELDRTRESADLAALPARRQPLEGSNRGLRNAPVPSELPRALETAVQQQATDARCAYAKPLGRLAAVQELRHARSLRSVTERQQDGP